MTPIVLALAVLLAGPGSSSAEGKEPVHPPTPNQATSKASPSAPRTGPAWEEQIIWHRHEAGVAAFFLPQSALEGVPLEELPVRKLDRTLLRRAFRLEGKPEWPDLPVLDDPWLIYGPEPGAATESAEETTPADGPATKPASDPYPPPDCYSLTIYGCGTHWRAATLSEAIASSKLTFLGRAVAVVPGLAPGDAAGVDMVYLEVVEVLRDTLGRHGPGQVIGLVQRGSRVIVAGLPLCSTFRYPEEERVRRGDLVLAVGEHHSSAPYVIEPWFRLRVEDGMVLPSSFLKLRDRFPLSLSELVASWATEAARYAPLYSYEPLPLPWQPRGKPRKPRS